MSRSAPKAACRAEAPGTPLVVLVHGVGFGPATLAPLARALQARARVVVLARRGYEQLAHLEPPRTVGEHVDDLCAELDRRGLDRVVIAGISGGATVALAAALSRPERVLTAIAHEPAVGSVSPELRAIVRGALAEGGGRRLVRVLAGSETWGSMGLATVAALDDSESLIEADARAFLEFEPRIPAPGSRIPLVCSLGERSSATRRQVAERLADRTGAPIAIVPRCGHLPQLDAPEAFAELILNHAVPSESERSL